jgi:hypothetical protein
MFLQWLTNLLVFSLCVQMFAAVIPGIEVDGRVPALSVAAALVTMGNLLTRFAVPLPIPALASSLVYGCIGNVVAVCVAAAVLPGVRVKAMTSVIALGLLMTTATMAVPYGWKLASEAGVAIAG